jgi:MAGE family
MGQDDRNRAVWKDWEEVWMKLLMIILTMILGNGRSIEFENLQNLLHKLGIDLETRHAEFGDMKELFALWIRQGYLDKYKDEVSLWIKSRIK